MDIFDAEKMLLFVAFVVPGFISLKCYQLVFPGTARSAADQLIDAVSYSCINYAILSVPILFLWSTGASNSYPYLYYLFVVFALLISPILIVVAWKYLRTRDLLQRTAPHPTTMPWDYVFQKRKTYWVKVTLGNGEIVAGRYGPMSFTSSAPAEPQIYLEERWLIGEEGEFVRKVARTAGVLISKDISLVEFKE